MSIFATLTGIGSSRDNGSAQRATDATNQQDRDTLYTANQGNSADQTLNSQLGNTNYYGTAQQVYGQQQNAAASLQAAANGTVPSAAAIQQGVGQQAANAGLQSAALSQQGAMNPALAARNMLNAQASAQQGIVASGTAQRATEQATARQQYASLLDTMQQQQQAQGQLQYTQGQNMLGNQNLLHQQAYTTNMGNAQQIYANQMSNIDKNTAANQAQAAALGQTLSSIGSGISGANILPGSSGSGGASSASGAAGALAAVL